VSLVCAYIVKIVFWLVETQSRIEDVDHLEDLMACQRDCPVRSRLRPSCFVFYEHLGMIFSVINAPEFFAGRLLFRILPAPLFQVRRPPSSMFGIDDVPLRTRRFVPVFPLAELGVLVVRFLCGKRGPYAWKDAVPYHIIPELEIKSSMGRRDTAQAERFLDRRAAIVQRPAAQSLTRARASSIWPGAGPAVWMAEARIAGLPARPSKLSAAAAHCLAKRRRRLQHPSPSPTDTTDGNSVLQLECCRRQAWTAQRK
jgi:hypothetical protein